MRKQKNSFRITTSLQRQTKKGVLYGITWKGWKRRWNKIKNNFESIENTDNAAELMCIVMNAKNLAEESIQVAAVAEKFIQTIDLKGVED